jgi:class 3 adenylate cyclase/tetratricopeptide (TPR) repeat protein
MKAQFPEQCIVTMLHYDIVGSTRHIADSEPEEARDMLRRWLAPAIAAVGNAGGFVVDPEGDGGLAVFGWPVACEDHADRACAAAWDLQHRAATDAPPSSPSGAPIQFRVGVHSGLVFFWREGGRARVSGVPVHLAAALQKAAAPGGVLISTKTLGLCRSKLVITPQPRPPALDDLGIDVLSLDARPRGLTGSEFARRYGSRIVGRGEELETLRRALPGAEEHGAVAIIGDAGIGKSRLAAALMEEAQAAGVQIYSYFGDGQETTTPFAAARALILQALQARLPLTHDQFVAALGIAELGAETIDRIAPVITGQSKDDRRRDTPQTPTALARALAYTFHTLTRARRVSVLVEDLHLLDAESRDFLRLLASENEPPISLLITGRPEVAADAEDIAHSVIRLSALPEADMTALAERLWDGEPLADDAMHELLRRADGLPFALEQIISSLDPRQLPAFDRLPLGVESIIHARVARLNPQLRRMVQALGVLGEETATELAVETVALDDDIFHEGLHELETLAFLHKGTSQSIRFRHALLAEACRTMLTRRQSEALHGAALKAIERRYPDDPTQFGRLAHHATHAGNDLLALDYYWQAGRHARRQSARQSMKLIFEQAMKATTRVGTGANGKFTDFVLLAFESMHQIGEFQRMMPLLRQTIDMTRAAGQREKVCIALSHLAMAHWLDALYEGGIGYAEEALDIAKELDHLPLRYYSQHNLASLLHVVGRVDRAVELMSELCSMFDGPKRAMRLGGVEIPGVLSRGFLAEFLVDVGRYREAIESGRDALEIAQAEREPFSEVMARIGLGEAYLHNSDNEHAVDCLLPAKQQLEHFGLLASDPTVCGHLAAALARSGRGDEALALTQRVFDLERISTPRAMHALWLGHTEARRAALGPAEAVDAANSAVEFARERAAAGSLVQALGLRARIYSEIDASDPRIATDREEQAALCAHFGLVAWEPGLASR